MLARIVIIDDDQRVRDFLTEYLTQQGWHVLAYSYAAIRQVSLEEPLPELIILNFDMPDGGVGWELLQRLKMADKTTSIPTLITTAPFELSAEVRAYLADRYVTVAQKPFNPQTILKIIQKTLHRASYNGGYFTQDRHLPILLVDDSTDLRDAFATVLRLEGYQVTNAINGLEALNAVASADYSLVLLDIDMPVMTGLEFLWAYDQQQRPHSPVIVCSGEANIRRDDLPAFVVEILIKPFDIDTFLKHVGKYSTPV